MVPLLHPDPDCKSPHRKRILRDKEPIMATAPQPEFDDASDSGDIYDPKPGHTLPGHTLPGYTVDALLAEGKVEEAHAELERLIQEGIDSGISPESPADMMERIRAKVRARAAAR